MQLVFQRTANEPYPSAEIKTGSFILGTDALSFKQVAIRALLPRGSIHLLVPVDHCLLCLPYVRSPFLWPIRATFDLIWATQWNFARAVCGIFATKWANICVQKFVCGKAPEPLALGIYDSR